MQQALVNTTPTSQPQERYVPMSYEAYRNMEHPTNCLVEWVEGTAIFHMPPSITHQDIVGLIYTMLRIFVLSRKIGFVGISPMEMCHTPGKKSREPDLLFVLNEHMNRVTKTEIIGPADVVFEIVSPSSVQRDRQVKLAEYEQAGVQEYWLIDPLPRKQEVLLYVASDIRKYYQKLPDVQGRYHSEIIPGFWIDPIWLWQTPFPDVRDIVREIDPAILQDSNAMRLVEKKGWELGRTEGIALGRTEGIAIGRTEGIALGHTKGIAEGRVQGQLEELQNGIKLALELKFGEQGLSLVREIAVIYDIPTLKAVQNAIRTAKTCDELRSIYT